jgi:hypothetical protein
VSVEDITAQTGDGTGFRKMGDRIATVLETDGTMYVAPQARWLDVAQCSDELSRLRAIPHPFRASAG